VLGRIDDALRGLKLIDLQPEPLVAGLLIRGLTIEPVQAELVLSQHDVQADQPEERSHDKQPDGDGRDSSPAAALRRTELSRSDNPEMIGPGRSLRPRLLVGGAIVMDSAVASRDLVVSLVRIGGGLGASRWWDS
jgi:hypothetical protein